MRVPAVASVCPPNECETFETQQVASDCMWSDPAKDEQVKHGEWPVQEVVLRTLFSPGGQKRASLLLRTISAFVFMKLTNQFFR